MCSSPNYTPPPPPQEPKTPDSTTPMRKRSSAPGAMAASTLLTGPSGIDTANLKLGKSSLLGA